MLYDTNLEKSNCGVGFITRKDGNQTHELLKLGHEALCKVPHRGGMASDGVGDGAGISVDLSLNFFEKLTKKKLKKGLFGVGNFFLPMDSRDKLAAERFVNTVLIDFELKVVLERDLPVNEDCLTEIQKASQLPIKQWIFLSEIKRTEKEFASAIYKALLEIEKKAFTLTSLEGLYPLSMSSKMQVLKGRLNSSEIIPFFKDLSDPDHKVKILYFHTRFSTNTKPQPAMAQPFHLIAHNGELNTDKKNRISENAIAQTKKRSVVSPFGQSDSCRLDQTIQSRLNEDRIDIVTAVVSMMPPAWENDPTLSQDLKSMFEYYSLYEEKNDGPAALIFCDGEIIGARLDRLGLRPLRSVETDEYLAVMSEAGQINFPPEKIISLGRIEAGGMLYFDHNEAETYNTSQALKKLASSFDYKNALENKRVKLSDLDVGLSDTFNLSKDYKGDLTLHGRFVAYSHNQESFKFLMDPMLSHGHEKISAMGYGAAINALSDHEGGMAKYFSQRFAQVTNPPLDSIREQQGMTLRVALGNKPKFGGWHTKQIVIESPILNKTYFEKLCYQKEVKVNPFEMTFKPVLKDNEKTKQSLVSSINRLSEDVCAFAKRSGGIALLSDLAISKECAPIPMILAVSAVNQALIDNGLRMNVSLVLETGQVSSSHHVACALGFGASAIYPFSVEIRSKEKFASDAEGAFSKFAKATEKALLKTMGKVGLCTVESFIGGEFFEPNFLETKDPYLVKWFPHMKSPLGGVGFDTIIQSVLDWHEAAISIKDETEIPILGLFKERSEGMGHSFGQVAVRGFVELTEEKIIIGNEPQDINEDFLRLLPLNKLEDAFNIAEDGYKNTSFEKLKQDDIDNFQITNGYRQFVQRINDEREKRPSALRDVLAFPADISLLESTQDLQTELMLFNRAGNNNFMIKGLQCSKIKKDTFIIELLQKTKVEKTKIENVLQTFVNRFSEDILFSKIKSNSLTLKLKGLALEYVEKIISGPENISIENVERASNITKKFASGAMSHGALVSSAHEAVAHGTNMVGALSNSGEGGEHISRFGTIRASKIKQFASGRFGVWAGYLADPMLEEIEIKIGQGAKPGEGGQLPEKKVNVEIAAARGGTPGVELISPPPHHDTYSIEDLAQLIHDAKAARVKVIVKLVSSEGIGTIAVGVAKAGADVINIAGNTGGTGAASVTALKYTGRAAEIGLLEVHQALELNNLRDKVVLRCSGAHQVGSDVVKSALLGADSFEFGTTALMMLKCVMAKNCNIKCPAGLTTNSEVFDGDPRALAQYFMNVAQEIREILAFLGFTSLAEARGKVDYLHLIDHPSSVGQLHLKNFAYIPHHKKVKSPKYVQASFEVDDVLLSQFKEQVIGQRNNVAILKLDRSLNNTDKTVLGQFSIDIERLLNHGSLEVSDEIFYTDKNNRRFLRPDSVNIETKGSAGQSFGAFCNDGISAHHFGTCNDGVAKSMCGGSIAIQELPTTNEQRRENVLIGNFALFGATGGRLFVAGEAGDRFAVRNSGATAVVEGVGDFFAEYMTNGTVLNLGDFSKGIGNGMSGGFAYQYDPYDKLNEMVSHESVIFEKITESELCDVHSEAVKLLLLWHCEATGSQKAHYFLRNWDKEKENFYMIMPRALLLYQDAKMISDNKPRKDLIDELAAYLSTHQIKKLKEAWKNGVPVQDGFVPDSSAIDDKKMYSLLNSHTVMRFAQNIVQKNVDITKDFDNEIRDLILTEDFRLMLDIQQHAKEAVSIYDDEQLAAMIASKRIGDFKETLSKRNMCSMESISTYGWIIHQSRKNLRILDQVPCFEELFAKKSLNNVMAITG